MYSCFHDQPKLCCIMQAIDTNAKNDKFQSKDMEGASCRLHTVHKANSKKLLELNSGASNHICGKNKWFTNSRLIPKAMT
ncbi:hypothetical protein PVAP13_1NG143500 [Panicum virgatum]|uniref:Uncharacterized protein n=1 Tax=Panicum virgatum TaxID=38727 RepID=A0A8T0WPM8_PANVG|nr:hypothetical protein PVAP13_1NG143500 [Panicum virgatum]